MINDFATKNKLPGFRIKQFNKQFYDEIISSFDELSTWPKELREKLKAEVEFNSLEPVKELVSKRKDTYKTLFNVKRTGKKIEAVLMRHKDGRNTVCVSCMVGCPVNCSFCATGKMGFSGNLTAQEIVDQVIYYSRMLKPVNQKVTNIVFMGMGEPMLNLEAVEESIRIFTSEDKMGMSQRRITISTSGYVTQFRKFIANGFRGRVAISLHAPNQELRAKLMPVAKQFSLDQLMYALDDYTTLNNKRVSYEYVMLKNVNDQDEHAFDLVNLLQNRLAHVNLIPYNAIREADFERSAKDRIKQFTKILTKFGINHSIRVTMGDDVNAACGQLADRENEKYKTNEARRQEQPWTIEPNMIDDGEDVERKPGQTRKGLAYGEDID